MSFINSGMPSKIFCYAASIFIEEWLYMKRGHLVTLKMTAQEYFQLVQLVADATLVIRHSVKTVRSKKILAKAKRCLFLLRVKNVALKSYQRTLPSVSLTGNEKRILL
ncbi:MAG: hypothetical protein WBE18_00150, partial [Gammaproteobacteria bacterium]